MYEYFNFNILNKINRSQFNYNMVTTMINLEIIKNLVITQ